MNLAPSPDHYLAALMLFVFINVILYSSLFTNWQGVPDAVKSIFLWAGRSGSEHKHEFLYYIGILFKLELPLLTGSLLAGIFIARRGTKFWLFVAAWTLGITLAYSIIGYKTPWLMISFLVPMALLSGHAAQRIYSASHLLSVRSLLAAAFVAVLIFNFRMARTVNFEKYDDNSNASGYVTTTRRNLNLIPDDDGLYGQKHLRPRTGA
jgi:predicted membrane-bound mannosyltransferase